MSDPIERRLRDSLSRRADDVSPAADGWLAIRERAEREDRRFARRRRTFRLAASGALAALVAVAVPLTLDRVRDDDDIAFAPPPAITAETATPTTPPTDPSSTPTDPVTELAAPQGWAVADDGGALTPGPFVAVEDAVALGPRVAAVGSFSPSPDATQAAVWLSDEGRDWRMVEDPAAFGGEANTYTEALGVAATSGGFVAVGTGYSGDEADLPRVWTSQDGTTWEYDVLPGDGGATAVTEVAGGRLVAVGAAIGFLPTVWTSADGVTWDVTVLDLLGAEGTLEAVVAAGQRVVALGRSSVVVSEDGGATWTQVAHEDAGLFGGAVEDLLVLGDGSLLAVMSTDSGVTTFTSDDGLAWEESGALPPSASGGRDRVAQVVALGDGTLVAAGLAFDAEGTSTVPAIWTSRDGGRVWVADDAFAPSGVAGQVTALAVTADTLVALGNGEGVEAPGRAWTRPLP